MTGHTESRVAHSFVGASSFAIKSSLRTVLREDRALLFPTTNNNNQSGLTEGPRDGLFVGFEVLKAPTVVAPHSFSVSRVGPCLAPAAAVVLVKLVTEPRCGAKVVPLQHRVPVVCDCAWIVSPTCHGKGKVPRNENERTIHNTNHHHQYTRILYSQRQQQPPPPPPLGPTTLPTNALVVRPARKMAKFLTT